jgi:4-amino-4-deoxy-L-arabinose transferase-like glycosyltransferase
MNKRFVLRWAILAILACAGLYLVGNGRVSLWDRDEPWYAQCSWKMILDHDYVVPRYLDGSLRVEKPPLIYWLHTAPMRLLGAGEFAPRLVSAVAMIGVLMLVCGVLWRMAGPRRAAWTTFILGTSLLTIAAAKMCLTDAVLLFFITAAQFCLLMFYRGKGSPWVMLIMALAIAMGFYDKGPIVFVAPAATLTILAVLDWRRWSRFVADHPQEASRRAGFGILGILVGLAAIAALVGPWAWMNHLREPLSLAGMLHRAESHMTKAMDGHSGFPGWYSLVVWATYFPWSLLLPTAAVIAFKHRKVPEIRFAIAAVIGPWLFHELLMKTKLPHYVLPAFPFLGFLTADALVRCIRGEHSYLRRLMFKRATLVWALILGVVPSVTWLVAWKTLPVWRGLDMGPLPWGAMVTLSIFGFVYTLGVWRLFSKERIAEAAGWLGGGFLLLIVLGYGWYVPNAPYLAVSKRVATLLHEVKGLASDGVVKGEVACLSYNLEAPGKSGWKNTGWREPSMDFYQGGILSHYDEDRLLERNSPENWPRVMIITKEIWEMSPPSVQSRLRVVGKVCGLSYAAEGHAVELWVVEKTALPGQASEHWEPATRPIGRPVSTGVTQPDK